MLNPFPLHYLSLLAYFVLRVTLGAICVTLGKRMLLHTSHSTMRRAFGALLMVVGAQLILGFYTQIAASILCIATTTGILVRRMFPGMSRMTLLLMTAVSFSLFITGAGVFAFDLPL